MTATQAPNGAVVTVTATGLKYLVVNSASLGDSAGYSVLNPTGESQIQLRRGTTAELDAITPADGEPVWDTTLDKLRIGNGTRAGGIKNIVGLTSVLSTPDDPGEVSKPVVRAVNTYLGYPYLQLSNTDFDVFSPENAASSTFPGGIRYASTNLRIHGADVGGVETGLILEHSMWPGNKLAALEPQMMAVQQADETFTTITFVRLPVSGAVVSRMSSGAVGRYRIDAFFPCVTTSTAGVALEFSESNAAISAVRLAVKMVTVANPATVRNFKITSVNTPVGHTGDTEVDVYITGTFSSDAAVGNNAEVFFNVAKNSAGAGNLVVKAGGYFKLSYGQ